ncbi:SRPBCC family protein [Pedococcus sp. KACC 23699]|uniref:SRPBCC family protein n=1 Tax=Pedococcus sp. KACC 23699 TaxID=3149228 RepID=A0AAU7JRH9_9MICO
MEQSATIDITAPVERVWAVLSDVERWSEWTDTVRWVRRLDDGPLRTGSCAKISQPKIPTVDYVVTELEPGTSFTWVSGGAAARTTARHVLEPLPGGGTHVTLSIEQTGWLGSLVGRLYRGITDRYLATEAAGLKARSEGLTS